MSRILRRLVERLAALWDALRLAPAARWVVAACLVGYLVQRIGGRVELAPGVTYAASVLYGFGLCPPLLARGFVWQVFTYMFLHANLVHLALNSLTLLLFGAGLEIEIGARRFLRVFALGGALGGLAWVGFDAAVTGLASSGAPAWLQPLRDRALAHRGEPLGIPVVCVGASGGIFALIGAYAALFPRRRIVLFVGWPLELRARSVAILLGLATVAFAIYGLGNVAYLTHLFGGAAGYLLGLRLARQGWGSGMSDE